MSVKIIKSFYTSYGKSLLIIGTLICCIIQASCASQHQEVTPQLRTQFLQDLKDGKLCLTCQEECELTQSWNLQKMSSLLKTKQYTELAVLVMTVGRENDLNYFLLGMSAMGLGYNESALKYFNYSLTLYNDANVFHHCRHGDDLTQCGGLFNEVDLAAVLPPAISEAQSLVDSAKNPVGYLAKLEGKDPVRENLWADSKFMDKLETTLGKQRAKQLVTGWGKGDPVATEITRVDDNLVFAACKPNDQCYHQAIIFISMIDGVVEACWQDAASSKSLSDFWLSPNAKPRKLPAGYCEMHDDTDLSKMFRQNTSDKTKLKATSGPTTPILDQQGSEGQLKSSIIEFYNQRGEWAGVFIIETITKFRIDRVDGNHFNIHAGYTYTPIPGNRLGRTDSGYDERVFTVQTNGSQIVVTGMGGYRSASF